MQVFYVLAQVAVFCRVTRLTVTEKPSDFIVEQEAGADLLDDPVVRHHRPFGQDGVRAGVAVVIILFRHLFSQLALQAYQPVSCRFISLVPNSGPTSRASL